MRTLPLFLTGLAAFWPCAPSFSATMPLAGAGVFFVATNGNDSWTGAAPTVTASQSDGPFATPERALAAARQWKQHNHGSNTTIYFRGGVYFQKEPLVLRPDDSGTTLGAFGNETPTLSGGRLVTGWKETKLGTNALWAAQVPDVRAGQWEFRELWVNGKRAIRARQPNHGYLKIAEVPDKAATWTEGQSRFRFAAGDVRNWPTVTQAEAVVMTRWVESRLPIKSVDEKSRMITFDKRAVFELSAGDPYYLEGARELLDSPGEWFLAIDTGTLYYWPRPGESLKNLQAVAPFLSQVLRLEGDPQSGRFLEGVHLRGIQFAHTEWYFPKGFASAKNKPTISPAPKPEIGGFAQAAIGVPGAVWGQGLRACAFEQCNFGNLGNYALELASGCQSNRITGCEFSHLGAGGIKLGETSVRDNPAEQTRANQVTHCRIHEGGRMFHSAIGIWLGQTPDNQLEHNLIHDFYYTGISIGWTWGYGKTLATNNLVAFNHVHHIGIQSDGDGPILSDMGGIYTLGMQPGTRVVNNLWHDIAGLRYGGWGIYFDEGSSGILAQSNVVYHTTHGGFHQHYGATNLVRNNIFAFARDHQLQRTRPEAHVSFSFQTNIVYFDQGVLLGGNWSNDNFVMDWNVYFDARPGATPESMRFAGATLEKWRARGHDLHSVIANPLFVAPDRSVFALKPGSPALRLGFRPIDLSHVGP